jgi:hypothetical protein
MPSPKKPEIEIVQAVAAAIVTSAGLPKEIAAQIEDVSPKDISPQDVVVSPKFIVHPHISTVKVDDPLLLSYLRRIYTDRPALETAYPGCGAFSRLASENTLKDATQVIAAQLADEMSTKNANAGILFGFIVRRSDGSKAHGIIKADLDHEERFYMVVSAEGEWDLGAVRELLPHPRTEFAKFVIAPQPGGVGAAGIRDITDAESAAAYFLAALQLTVPKTRGTRAAVARAALKAGYSHNEVQAVLKPLTSPAPVVELVRENFPRIPAKDAERLAGRPERPMPEVLVEDPYLRVYKTRSPHFELIVDDSVDVKVNGLAVTVTLPSGSDRIEENTRER